MFQDPLLNAFATLVITVGVVAVLLFLVKKYSGKFTNVGFINKQIKIETKQSLTSKSSLYIIQAEGRRFLIGANDNNISKIAELDQKLEQKIEAQSPPNEIEADLTFANFLKQSFIKKK